MVDIIYVLIYNVSRTIISFIPGGMNSSKIYF